MGWDSPPYEGRRWRYGWDYEPPKKTLSEVLDTIDGQYKDAQKLRNQITQSIMEKHLKSKAYPGLIQETTPLKEYLALVNAYLNDLIRKKGDTDNMVFKFMRERHDSIAKLEQRIQELEDEKAGLEPEEDHMMKSDIQLQTGVGTTCRNEGFKDVATVIEKHRDIAERLRQLKTVICNHSCSFSDEEDKIAKEIQRSIPLNAKRLGELQRKRPAENKIVRHGQAKRPCGNNQMSIQNHDNQAEEHLVMNGQYLVQLVKDSIKEHVQQNKGRVTEVPCESMTVNASDASVEKLIEATNDTATIASSEICFSNVSLTDFSPETLTSIIGFLKDSEIGCHRRELLNLRLVNHDFNYLLRPLFFESISLPHKRLNSPSVTSDARELLRLINNDPSLASCIQCLTYDDPDDSELPLTDEYSQEQLTHDHKIFSQFSAELAEKSASKKTFGSSRKTSKLREMSVIYNKACIPILISRLPNLRKLVFAGRLGGKHSFLLTPAAKHIWQWMPPKSLQVLDWRPETYAPYLALLDKYEDKAYENQPTQHTDPWDAVSFLQLTPKMQHLTIVDDTFFTKTSRINMPLLENLTVLEWCGSRYTPLATDISQCFIELFMCTPRLKKFTCRSSGDTRLNAQQLKDALQIVRTTIEEIEFAGKFKDRLQFNGGIGPFSDFPNLRKLSTDIQSLMPPWNRSLEDFSLLDILPPTLESLHLTDARKYFKERDDEPFDAGKRIPNSSSAQVSPRTFFRILEDVALAKKRGPLKRLSSLGIHCNWSFSGCKFSEEGFQLVASICEGLGIEWHQKVRKHVET